eukprot:TRINITY_DN15897_c0_g1_i1.p1 TRINITY_DN15897_c0_g1~~TRINITY_DN15897_c0_g1_i1.p1  ORF type:complete len:175 (+),score=10.17 TRINITY_DN15897_c0_g1_i1:220-744(+)
MSAAVSLVSAQVGGTALHHRCIPAGPGRSMRAIPGHPQFAAPSVQHFQQRRGLHRVVLCAGPGDVAREEEQGEGSTQHNLVTVHVNEDDLRFTSNMTAQDILANIEVVAGPGILVRAGDSFSPLREEKVPGGEYVYKTGLKNGGRTKEQAAVSQELQALRGEIAKLRLRRKYFL